MLVVSISGRRSSRSVESMAALVAAAQRRVGLVRASGGGDGGRGGGVGAGAPGRKPAGAMPVCSIERHALRSAASSGQRAIRRGQTSPVPWRPCSHRSWKAPPPDGRYFLQSQHIMNLNLTWRSADIGAAGPLAHSDFLPKRRYRRFPVPGKRYSVAGVLQSYRTVAVLYFLHFQHMTPAEDHPPIDTQNERPC